MVKAYTLMITMRNAHSILFRNPEGDCLEELGTGSRIILKWIIESGCRVDP
jgi:hypothetical protein